MTHQDTALLPAFNNEVQMTQQTFRGLLTALSEPATLIELVQDIPTDKDMPSSLIAMWAVAQTVLDNEVPVWVDDHLPDSLAASIRFFTGATLVSDISQAMYVFTDMGRLSAILANNRLNLGTLEKPHTAATVVILAPELSSVSEGETSYQGCQLKVSGAGVPTVRHIHIAGLTAANVQKIQDNNRLFPCGVDWILCAANCLTALPRTSRIDIESSPNRQVERS